MRTILIHISKIVLLQLVLLFSVVMLGQNNAQEQKKIDSVITKVYTFEVNYKPADLRHIATKMLHDSEEIGYNKGLAYGNYLLGRVFIALLDNKKSIYYTNQSLKYLKNSEDKALESLNYTLLGACYQQLEFYSEAVKNYKKAVSTIKNVKINAVAKQQMFSNAYFNISDTYSAQGKLDSAYYYLNKNKALYTVVKSPNNYAEEASVYMKIGQFFTNENKLDSAAFYINQSLKMLKDKNHVYESQALKYQGDFYHKKGDVKEAINQGLSAMQIAEKFHDVSSEIEAAQALQTYYSSAKDYKNLALYSDRNQKMNAELKKQSDAERNAVFDEILKEKKVENDLKERKLHRTQFLIVGILVLAIIGFSFIIYRNRQKARKKLLRSSLILVDQEKIIMEKQQESEVLRSKVNESFAEVIELAKRNSPEFLTRFQEVYPDFIEKIKRNNPDLRVPDLILSAYIFLGFGTKDIAEYTFKSVRTIQGAKSRLRTKLDISADENLELWILHLLNEK